jgi:TonB family protein
MSPTARITDYPKEQHFVPWGLTGSFGFHLAVVGLVLLVAFLTHVKTIQQLMAEGGSLAQNGPAPQESMEVFLRPDDLPPPPPTVNPEFIKQVELPKPVVIPPPPIPIVPPPRPVIVQKPRYTAPKATGSGETASVSRLVVGSSGFPQPSYPYQAMVRHETGTVTVGIQFDASGSASDVDVVESSGVALLDSSTRSFIRENWRNESFAGKHVSVPIEYHMN